MIKDKLLDLDYYHLKLPLYMRNMDNLKEHFNLWYDLLVSLNVTGDTLFNYLDIFNENYLNINNVDRKGYEFEFLEFIGYLWGVNRNFEVSYTLNGKNILEKLRLNNELLLILIKARLLRNNFKGTFEELQYLNQNILKLNISYITSQTPAYCDVYADESNFQGENGAILKHLFYAGLLNLDSMGIIYNYYIVNIYSLGIWDDDNILRRWGPQDIISEPNVKAARWG